MTAFCAREDSASMAPGGKGATGTFPKKFVDSMKTLFDIMDEDRTGVVNISDIERGWQENENKDLPHGVVESLRKVAPMDGMLTFERFCTGLKICLLRQQYDQNGQPPSAKTNIRSMLQPMLSQKEGIDAKRPDHWLSNSALPPRSKTPNQRAVSLPQLGSVVTNDLSGPPPKPPRSGVQSAPKMALDKAEIRSVLHSWQRGILSEMDVRDKHKNSRPVNPDERLALRGTADGGSTTDVGIFYNSFIPTTLQKKSISKRREPRRHTLQNGIDNNLLKRLKLFEAEKEVLLKGLSAVENAREWYLKQVIIVQEKIKFLGYSGSHLEQWSEAHQERLEFQKARVVEINRHLSALQTSWERGGFPPHMNLEMRHSHSHHQSKQGNEFFEQIQMLGH